MYDYLKIQLEILKDANKRLQGRKCENWFYGYIEQNGNKYIGVSTGHYISFIPEDYFFLDAKKAFPFRPEAMDFEQFIKNRFDAKPILLTSELVRIGAIKKPLNVFQNGKGEKIHCNSAYLDKLTFFGDRYFAPDHFTGTDRKSLIYIWSESDELRGVILPVDYNSVV